MASRYNIIAFLFFLFCLFRFHRRVGSVGGHGADISELSVLYLFESDGVLQVITILIKGKLAGNTGNVKLV